MKKNFRSFDHEQEYHCLKVSCNTCALKCSPCGAHLRLCVSACFLRTVLRQRVAGQVSLSLSASPTLSAELNYFIYPRHLYAMHFAPSDSLLDGAEGEKTN